METTSRLHPLLTAAAISVTVFSAVGVGALTGLLPNSIGSSQREEVVSALPAEPEVKPSAPVVQSQPAAEIDRQHVPARTGAQQRKQHVPEPLGHVRGGGRAPSGLLRISELAPLGGAHVGPGLPRGSAHRHHEWVPTCGDPTHFGALAPLRCLA